MTDPPNQITKVRAEVLRYFDPNAAIAGSDELHASPSGRYRLTTQDFMQTKADVNWVVKRVELFDTQRNARVLDFVVNDSHFFFTWATHRGSELLICAEDVFGGQTIIDLGAGRVESYSPDLDGFIWIRHHLSPDGTYLAVVGCFWACPGIVRIYDFSDPFNLPLPEVLSVELEEREEVFAGWKGTHAFTLRDKTGQEREVPLPAVD
jgi:hypothetical protein